MYDKKDHKAVCAACSCPCDKHQEHTDADTAPKNGRVCAPGTCSSDGHKERTDSGDKHSCCS